MYSHRMLDYLQPRHAQGVLALKAGGKLADPAAIDWDWVAEFINTQERNETSRSSETVSARSEDSWSVSCPSSVPSGPRRPRSRAAPSTERPRSER